MLVMYQEIFYILGYTVVNETGKEFVSRRSEEKMGPKIMGEKKSKLEDDLRKV